MARLGQETGRGRGEEGRWFHKTAPSPELGWVGSGQMEPQGSVMNDRGRQGSLVVQGQRRCGERMLISNGVPWAEVPKRGPRSCRYRCGHCRQWRGEVWALGCQGRGRKRDSAERVLRPASGSI